MPSIETFISVLHDAFAKKFQILSNLFVCALGEVTLKVSTEGIVTMPHHICAVYSDTYRCFFSSRNLNPNRMWLDCLQQQADSSLGFS